MKKLALLLAILFAPTMVLATVEDLDPFTQMPSQSYHAPIEPFIPSKMTPIIAYLPEYKQTGPGYICEMRQPAPVYRFKTAEHRTSGYAEPNWHTNIILNQYNQPINYGGYTY